jgi:protease PrsW
MTIFHIILAWLAVFASYLFWIRIKANVKEGRPFWDFAPFNFLVIASAIAFSIWLIVFTVHPEPDLSTADAKIRFGNSTHQPWITNEGLAEQIDSTPDSIELHFEQLRNHFLQRDKKFAPPDLAEYRADEQELYTYYSDLSTSTDPKLHDIGHIMLAYFFLSQDVPEYRAAAEHLGYVDDPTTKYVNYLAGNIMFSTSGISLAQEHFKSELRNKGYKEGAYRFLAVAFEHEQNDSMLTALVYSNASRFVPDNIRTSVYFKEGDVVRFYRHKLSAAFRNLTGWGISGGIAIMLVWMYFLWSLTFISRISIPKLLLPFIGGLIFATLSWWIYAVYKSYSFGLNGDVLNDALFSVAGVGLIEEVVKLIPFLLILNFTHLVKKPIDYIVVASACGLGFAVLENLMYIANEGLDVIHSRALTSSLSHMACSGIVAYGFILRRYRWTTRWWLIPLFFILATAAHGFYDFWLLNDKVRSLGVITLLFFLSEILIYISFINNALNQSAEIGGTDDSIHLNAQRLTSVVAGSFILLFAFEYLATCLVYGTTYGNHSLTTAFLSGGYLVFFLSVRLAQIKIEPGKWNRIDFLSGILPSQMYSKKEED